MKLKQFIYLFVLSFFVVTACRDVAVSNLEKKEVTVLAPPDNYSSTNSTVTFWWEELDGADDYRLQIVSTTFSNIQQLVADTLTKSNKFSISISPGEYQWRVRAENNSSETDFVVRSFKIDSTNDLATQTVILLSPNDNSYSNQNKQTFRWESLYNATEYRVRIGDVDFTTLLKDTTTQADSLVYTFASEGTYQWQVRAQNSTSSSPYTTRTLIIDITAPNKPTLISPADNSSVTLPDTLRWSPEASTMGDSLYVFHPDSTTLLSGFPTYVTNTFYKFNFVSSDTVYYWKVRTVDFAGNVSSYSDFYKFITQ